MSATFEVENNGDREVLIRIDRPGIAAVSGTVSVDWLLAEISEVMELSITWDSGTKEEA